MKRFLLLMSALSLQFCAAEACATALVGNEILQVQGISANGAASYNTEQITTRDIANLAGVTPTVSVTTTLGNTSRAVADHFADVYNAADWGVKCDGTALVDINITNATATATSASYTFTAADVGKTAVLTDTNETSILTTTISSISSGNAVLAANWTHGTLSNSTGRLTFYTTDNTTAIAAAIT